MCMIMTMDLPEMTNRVPIESVELSGKGKGTSSAGISLAEIGSNASVLSIVETNVFAWLSSRFPCINAIPFPEDQIEPTYDISSVRVAFSVASNSA